ncbi:hypothetical protein BKA70DRAFT_1220230 [Coprinopsis sp. MPI-PUGE-AT-0042]|nr:hypothetical protein BKA70DRAFT_1220230 [Coprinopsis sp. MPI-PUGE-AT-0042]
MPACRANRQKSSHGHRKSAGKGCNASYVATYLPNSQTIKEDPLVRCGHTVARTMDAFERLPVFVPLQRTIESKMTTDGVTWRNLEGMQRSSHELYLDIKELIVRDTGINLTQVSKAVLKTMIGKVSRGQASASIKDLKALKSLVPRWIHGLQKDDAVPELVGFQNDVYGRLLCLVTLDWSRDEVKHALRSSAQTFKLGAWPRILFQNWEYDQSLPWDGFLQSRVLIKVVDSICCPESCEKGAVRLLYQLLKGYLMDVAHRKQVSELLAWWERKLFGPSLGRVRESGGDVNDMQKTPVGVVSDWAVN